MATFVHSNTGASSSSQLAGSQPTVVKPPEKVDYHRQASRDISMEATCMRNWEDLPKELLEQILSHLYGEDVRSFHLVCRSWHAAEECVFQKEHNPLVFPVPQSQWLLHKQCSELNYQFIHPVYPNVRYAKNLLEDAGKLNDEAISCHSKDGWLLMCSGRGSLFFFSPFPKKVIELPELIWLYELDGVTFSCPPSASTGCCVVFVISYWQRTNVYIATIRLGKKKWKINQYDNNIPFKPSYCNPVFLNKMFYCLSPEGNLGVYNHKEDTWIVLEKPLSSRKKWAYENYLVEHEGGLMSLFMGESGSWVSIFKLNEFNVWENVYSLGDYALFVSIRTTFATKSVLEMMKNKIFLPLLHNNYPVFYSLQTKTFGTYGSNLCENNLCKTEIAEQLESCWIEPREICCEVEECDWFLESIDEETDEETEYETDTDYVYDEVLEDGTNEDEEYTLDTDYVYDEVLEDGTNEDEEYEPDRDYVSDERLQDGTNEKEEYETSEKSMQTRGLMMRRSIRIKCLMKR